MDTIQEARKILIEAEASLRQLMEKALKQQRYADVREIASIAQALARVNDGQMVTAVSSSEGVGDARSRRSLSPRQSSKSKGDYPRFAKDGDKLVKIGWSKRNGRSYEHRAPVSIVKDIVRQLAGRVKHGEVFVVENLIPVVDSASGAEIPAYQVYMTLAWLREVGSIEKKGRDGYVLNGAGLAGDEFEALWAEVKARQDTERIKS